MQKIPWLCWRRAFTKATLCACLAVLGMTPFLSNHVEFASMPSPEVRASAVMHPLDCGGGTITPCLS